MKLYLIRHLPTSWNIEGRLQGTKDISISLPLSEESLLKIKKNQSLLSNIQFDAVFVSEKKRTLETAQQYGFHSPEKSPLINEIDFGPFEGTIKKEAVDKMGKDFMDNPFNTTIGESYRKLEQNIASFLKSIQDKKNVLVFGHGTFIRGTKCFVENGNIMKINSFPLLNNEIIELEIN